MPSKSNTEELVRNVRQLRSAYNNVKKALPWLDGCIWEEDKISYRGSLRNIETPYIRSSELQPSMKGRLSSLRNNNIHLLRYNPSFGSLFHFSDCFPEMAENNIPLVVLHTDVSFGDIGQLANTFTSLKIIIESGPRKILYFIDDVKKILKNCMNVYLSTYNFCNWYGHEEIFNMGLANKLLYGSHLPEYSADASMGQIIISNLGWETKCDIAGNNLRRLLGFKPVICSEVKYESVPPFIIDSHTHNIQSGGRQIYKMPTPDMTFQPVDWIDYMDLCSVEQIYLTPATVLMEKLSSSLPYVRDLLDFRPERFFYYEVFSPVEGDRHLREVQSAIKHPGCIGIKIHPSFHRVDADDDRFEIIYRLAEEWEPR
jgi:predicted TIM-barrel fold metal-dependent hydrolase